MIYILWENSGEYEDYSEVVVAVYANKHLAEEHQRLCKEAEQKRKKPSWDDGSNFEVTEHLVLIEVPESKVNAVNQDIVKAVEDRLNAAKDNLHRARAAFRNCTAHELQSEYGESGKTRAQLVDGYAAEVKRWETALTEAKGT